MDFCCPVVIFAFNRPRHLQTTLDALAANNLSESTDVTIICDGPRGPQDVALTDAVRLVAHGEKRFRSVTVQVNPENRGLATNIISGVTAMLEAHGRVIVLEDDLATSPYFLAYMNDALNLYADDATVASIQGWCFPHAATDAPDTFFLRGADCWGWATWQRAWKMLEQDANLLLEQIRAQKLQRVFNADGQYDYEYMLKDAAAGRVSSWAVRWHASAFLQNCYSLYPARSLVLNKGFDTGTHFENYVSSQQECDARPVPVTPQPVCENRVMRTAYNVWLRNSVGGPVWYCRIKRVLNKCRSLATALFK